MKTIINKLTYNIGLVALLGLAPQVHAQHTASGGGGIKKDGQYMTFYSAGIKVVIEDKYQKEKGKSSVPGLNELINFLKNDELFFKYESLNIMKALVISANRRYFDIDDSWLTPQERERIINEYKKITKQPTNNLTLYAVTDTNTNTTFIFPEFYQLQTLEQQETILFHEAQWIQHPYADYNTIVRKELAFQGYLENPQSVDRALDLIKVFFEEEKHEDRRILTLLYKKDQELGSISSDGYFINANERIQITLQNLLGSEFLECITYEAKDGKRYNSSYIEKPNDTQCEVYLIQNSEILVNKFPNSYIIKRFRNAVYNHNFFVKQKGYTPDFGISIPIQFDNGFIGYKTTSFNFFESNYEATVTLYF